MPRGRSLRCPEAEVFGDARRQKLDEDIHVQGWCSGLKRQEEGNEDDKEKESGGKVANV